MTNGDIIEFLGKWGKGVSWEADTVSASDFIQMLKWEQTDHVKVKNDIYSLTDKAFKQLERGDG